MHKINEKLNLLMLIAKAASVISRKLQSQGLSFTDIMMLHAISGAPDGRIRCVDLADQIRLTPSGVTRLLGPLEKFGVLKRIANEYDARSSYIVLTPAGKSTLKDAISILEDYCEDLIPQTNATSMSEISDLIKEIVR